MGRRGGREQKRGVTRKRLERKERTGEERLKQKRREGGKGNPVA